MFFYKSNILTGGDFPKICKIPSMNEGIEIDTIGSLAFYNNKTIEKVIIPNTIKKIEDRAFTQCSNLKEIEFEEGSNISIIEKSAFSYCNSLETVKINSISEKLDIFENCFYNSGLKKLDLSKTNISELHDAVFYNSRLKEIIFPEKGITKIGEEAFQWSMVDESIFRYLDVKEIPEYTFCNCKNIKEIPYEWLNKINHIAPFAFFNCGFKRLELPSKNIYSEECFSCNEKLKEVVFRDGLDNFCTSRKMFSRCLNLYKVKLPQNIVRIKNSTFNKCKISEIQFPERLKNIDSSAFRENALKSLDLSRCNINEIGKFAFYGNNLNSIKLNPYNTSSVYNYGCFGDNNVSSKDISGIFFDINETAFCQ